MKTNNSRPEGVRVSCPQRQQVEMQFLSLDQMVPDDHRVRVVWAYVDGLDLGPLYALIRAVERRPGRDAVDPKILVALWLFATLEGVTSARQLERCCERDLIYRWICGGVSVNHHLLSDFYTSHETFLDDLLTDSIATLLHQKVVSLDTVTQDGMRVRASAGSSSFRREKTLIECRDAAAKRLEELRAERESEPSNEAIDARRQKARERAAREQVERAEHALQELTELRKQKEARKKGSGQNARCSLTDPEARVMKMPDLGYRPAYNVQFMTDSKSGLLVHSDVNNRNDGGQMATMHAGLVKRYGVTPKAQIADGGFTTHDSIQKLESQGTRVIGPIPKLAKLLKNGTDPYARQKRDTDEMAAFRQRMATEEAKELYKTRAGLAEYPNAVCRNRGLTQYRVRGQAKVKAATLWFVMAFNFLRMKTLGCLPGAAKAS